MTLNRALEVSPELKAQYEADPQVKELIDTAIKILIAVVLGALLLAGLYTLFGDTVLPTVTERVEEMFDYKG